MLPSKPSGFLAKSKEGLRKVSDKMKEKELAKKEEKTKTVPMSKITESPSSSSSESLQVRLRLCTAKVADSRPSCASDLLQLMLFHPPRRISSRRATRKS